MAESSTGEKSHMLELDDDSLMKILSYLDHCSQLDVMLVCRRFEALIGQNVQFFKNHRLVLERKQTAIRERQRNPDGSSAPKSRKLMYFGRYFGDVKLIDYIFKPESIFFQPLLDTFEIIGSKINKLEIKNSRGYKNSVLEVLQLADNVKELIIERTEIIQNPRNLKCKPDFKKCTFPELRSLELFRVSNFAQIEEAFDSVDSLHHLKLNMIGKDDWDNNYQQLLFKQEDLRSLALEDIVVGSFQMKNWNIEKLVLKSVTFPQPEVFQIFVNFIKSLNNVAELEIEFKHDERINGNNYDEILKHLLNLPSLTKLKWETPKSALNVRNPSVKNFASTRQENYSEICRYFPNIETLEFVNYWIFLAMTGIESLVNLREIKFDGMGPFSLTMLNCPQLQKISADRVSNYPHSDDWKVFFQRHPNIEYMEYNADPHKFRYGQHFVQTLKIFTSLKTLKCYDTIKSWPLVKLIGDKMTRLEHLEIVVPESSAWQTAKHLRSKFPQLGCDSRKFQKKKNGSWSWLITLRKF
jgi:hypothetical protein